MISKNDPTGTPAGHFPVGSSRGEGGFVWLQKWFDHFFFMLRAASGDWDNLGIT